MDDEAPIAGTDLAAELRTGAPVTPAPAPAPTPATPPAATYEQALEAYMANPEGGFHPPAGAGLAGVERDDQGEVVGALADRSRKRAVAIAKGKLNDLITPAGAVPPPGGQAVPPAASAATPVETKAPEDAPPDEQGQVSDAFTAAARRVSDAVVSPAKSASAPPMQPAPPLGTIARDIARGTVEAPRQVVGGIRDALQATADLADWLTGVDAQQLDLPGGKSVKVGDVKQELPEVKHATTVTGGIVRGVSQFLAGFAGAGKVTGPLKALGKAGAVAEPAVKGALSNFVAFDAHQERLSNLIQQFPDLANPVNAYLAAKPGDGEAEGRFKGALEGLGLGLATEGLLRAVRYVRDVKRAQNAPNGAPDASQMAAREQSKPREAQPMLLLGDPDSPDLLWQGERPAKLKVEPEFGVPDHTVAMAVSRDALTPLSEGKNGVYVNFARIASSDDVKAVIGKTAEAFKQDIDAARRGVRTHEDTMRAANGVDAWQELLGRRVGDTMNAETTLAARRLWEASAAKLLDVANVATHTPTPENLFQFRKMMAIHATIQQEVIAARTETARALNAWKIPAGGGGAERLRSIENLLQTYGGDHLAQDMAARVAALGRSPDGMSALADVVEKGVLTRSREVATEIWINAILSNPKTHIVNMLGNGGAVGVDLVERLAASAFSRSLGSGELQVGEAAAKAYGLRQGIREGFSMFARALRTGESQFGVESTKVADAGFDRAITASTFDATGAWAKLIDGMGAIINTPTRFLNAEDDFFKAIAYRMEVNAQAFRQASQEVIDGKVAKADVNARIADLAANPPESIRLGAGDYARYQTFTQQPGALVQGLGQIEKKLASGGPGGELGAFAMRLLIPFRNTPANLIKYSFERTPMAPLMTRYREAIARGGPDADIARTRMALGTVATLALMDYAMDGVITGGGPQGEDNRGTKQTMERAGWQPYSIKIGDRYYSYRRSDPFGMSVGMAADLAEIINNAQIDEDKAQSVGQVTAMMSATFGNLLLAKNWLSGLSDLVDTLRNSNKAPNFYSKTAASFLLPAVAGEARRQIDPYMRYTDSFLQDLRNKTPGLSKDLPMARDMWGRPRSYQSGLGTVYDAISPVASRVYKPEPIDKEAIANDFNLAMPGKNISYGNHLTVSLANRGEAYSRLLEIRGQMKPSDMYQGKDAERVIRKYGDLPLLDLLNKIVTGEHELSSHYAAASTGRNGGKDQMVSRIVSDYGRAARISLLAEMNEIKSVVERKKAKMAGQ